uniref:Uncharacterized protein n=1 Tax=Oryza sativa subsp. japonica TaxID=39947 RepID=Q6K318_ORYSJ|nr:hypothetical protein [Oryza sativa Japonica Group]
MTIKYIHTTKHEKYKPLPKNTSDEWMIYEILKSNEFWNPVRPPETTLTSNGPSAFMPTPIWIILDFVKSLSRYLSNASGLMSKFISIQRGGEHGCGLDILGAAVAGRGISWARSEMSRVGDVDRTETA